MSNKFVDVETIRGVDGTTERCITEVDWEALRHSVKYQGVVVKKNHSGYCIEEPVKMKEPSKIISKIVKPYSDFIYRVGDVVEYNDVYEAEIDICINCMGDLFFDEQEEEYYCPVCE